MSNSSEDFTKLLEDIFHTGILTNIVSLELLNNFAQTKTSWDQLLKLLLTLYIEATERTIETQVHEGSNYKTIIRINEDVTNHISNANDIYWIRHNQLVDQAVALQKQIIEGVA